MPSPGSSGGGWTPSSGGGHQLGKQLESPYRLSPGAESVPLRDSRRCPKDWFAEVLGELGSRRHVERYLSLLLLPNTRISRAGPRPRLRRAALSELPRRTLAHVAYESGRPERPPDPSRRGLFWSSRRATPVHLEIICTSSSWPSGTAWPIRRQSPSGSAAARFPPRPSEVPTARSAIVMRTAGSLLPLARGLRAISAVCSRRRRCS